MKKSFWEKCQTILATSQYSPEEYKEYKKELREQAYHIIEEQSEKIAKSPEHLKKYLDLQSRLDWYSVSNLMLILAQQPNATQLKEFEKWREKNIGVKRGEKGISILEPYTYEKEDGSQGTGYNVKKVFDVSQTMVGKFERQTPRLHIKQALRLLVTTAPVLITATDGAELGEQNAAYSREAHTIKVRRGLSEGVFFYALCKEISNARFYLADKESIPSECNRISESVAYMMAKEFGIDEAADQANPTIMTGADIKGIRDELNLGKSMFSRMKNDIYLEADHERKSADRER